MTIFLTSMVSMVPWFYGALVTIGIAESPSPYFYESD